MNKYLFYADRIELERRSYNKIEVDRIAFGSLSATVGIINGHPNGRNGSFRAGMFSID